MRALPIVVFVFLAPPLWGATPSKAPQKPAGKSAELRATTHVEAPELRSGSATQFLATDAKQHVFVLRGDTLQVFQLRDDSSLAPAGRLECDAPEETAYAAAMDPKWNKWTVARSLRSVQICDAAGKEEPAGLDRYVSGIAYGRTGPVVAVIPVGSPASSAGMTMENMARREPRTYRLEDQHWETATWSSLVELDKESDGSGAGTISRLKAATDALVCASPKGSTWLALWNAYRLQEVSDSERPRTDVLVGDGRVTWEKRSDSERKAIAGAESGRTLAGVSAARPKGVVKAILCAPDESILLAVDTAEGFALDRWLPREQRLERTMLAGVKASRGPMSLALTSEELIVAGRMGDEGLWRFSWPRLEQSAWQTVAGAQVNGKPLLP